MKKYSNPKHRKTGSSYRKIREMIKESVVDSNCPWPLQSLKSNNKSEFCMSQSGYVDALEKFGDGARVINACYTDYGGSFMDRVLIEYYKQYYPDMAVIEDTSWNGQNMIALPVEGLFSRDFFYEIEGFEDLYYEIERELQEEEATRFCDAEGCDDRYEEVLNWIEENGNVHATEVDFDYGSLRRYLNSGDNDLEESLSRRMCRGRRINESERDMLREGIYIEGTFGGTPGLGSLTFMNINKDVLNNLRGLCGNYGVPVEIMKDGSAEIFPADENWRDRRFVSDIVDFGSGMNPGAVICNLSFMNISGAVYDSVMAYLKSHDYTYIEKYDDDCFQLFEYITPKDIQAFVKIIFGEFKKIRESRIRPVKKSVSICESNTDLCEKYDIDFDVTNGEPASDVLTLPRSSYDGYTFLTAVNRGDVMSALEGAVAYIQNNHVAESCLTSLEEIEDEFESMDDDEKQEFGDMYGYAEEYLNFIYVDPTMAGGDYPCFVSGYLRFESIEEFTNSRRRP